MATGGIEEKVGESSITPTQQVETLEARYSVVVENSDESSITTGVMDWALDVLIETIDGFDSNFGNRVAQDGATSEGGNQVAFSDPDDGVPDTEHELESASGDEDRVDEVENKALSVEVANSKHLCQ